MWYNACYMMCERPGETNYAQCPPSPSPPPSPVVSSPPPPPACEPESYPYKTITKDNSADCRTYILFDVDAGRCLRCSARPVSLSVLLLACPALPTHSHVQLA